MKRVIILLVLILGVAFLRADVTDQFIDAIVSGNFDEAESYYSPEMVEALQKGKLENVWKGILRNTGDFEVVVESSRQDREDFYSVVTTIKFENIYMDMVTTVNQNQEISGLFFRQSQYTGDLEVTPPYVDANKFIEEEVEFTCGDYTIYASLVLPQNARNFPIIVMATGSGPNDRDEKVGPNKPFKNIAYGLAGLGVASLRYDKRTLTYGAELARNKDLGIDFEYTQEVQSAVDFVTNKYKGRDVFFLGHSMGGMMVPRIMKEVSHLQGAIMMAGNARPLEDLVIEQTEYIMIQSDEINKYALALTQKAVEEVKGITNMKVDVEEPLLLDLSKAYWLSLNIYDILKEAKAIRKPVLVLQGERDYQVTMQDFNLWAKNSEGAKNWNFKSYPDLNHLFMTGQGKSLPQEYMKPGYVDLSVIDDIARFVKSR